MYHGQNLRRLKACILAASVVAISSTGLHAQDAPQMPPPAVGVLDLKAHAVPVVSELPGRVAATRTSEVRARVSGILLERVFQQGTLVKQGDVLYRIDPRLFRVRVESAEASLRRAEATRDNAKVQFERQKTLRERNVSAVSISTTRRWRWRRLRPMWRWHRPPLMKPRSTSTIPKSGLRSAALSAARW